MLFAKNVFTVFLEGHILLGLLYPISLIVAYALNENKPQLLATFENWGRWVAKQLLRFSVFFSPWTFSNLVAYKKIV